MGDQERAGLATMGAFFRRYVGDELEFDPYMTGELQACSCPTPRARRVSPGLRMACEERLMTSYFPGAFERLDVIRPEPDDPLGLSAVGTSLTGSGFSNPYLVGGGIDPLPATTAGGYDWCNPEPLHFTPSAVGGTGLPTAEKGCPLPPAAALGGQNGVREQAPVNHSYGLQLALAWDAPASLGTRLPAAVADVSGFEALALGAAVNFFDLRNGDRFANGGAALWNPAASTQDFVIALTDRSGREGTVAAGNPRYGNALHPSLGDQTSRTHVSLASQVTQPVDPGREVVLAAAHGDHARERAVEERRAAGHGHLVQAVVVHRADDRILVVAEPERVARVRPLGLHELELAGEAGLDGHEDHAAVGAVVLGAFGQQLAVGDAAPDQAMTVHQLAVERHAQPRVHAADVRADRAAQPLRVAAVVERVVARLVGHQRRVLGVRRGVERRAVAPAADELGGQQLLAAGIELGGLAQPPPERRDVLAQLAVDDVGAVAAQLVRRRGGGQRALLVGSSRG